MTENHEMLLNDLRSLAKGFNRSLVVGMLFVIIGHFYVVEPYFKYIAQKNILTEMLNEKEPLLRDMSKRQMEMANVMEKANLSFRKTENDIYDFPNQLRKALPKIKEVFEGGNGNIVVQSASAENIDDMYIPSNIKNYGDAVRWYISEWLDRTTVSLEKQAIIPLAEQLKGAAFFPDDKSRVAVYNFRQNINAYFGSVNPDFWKDYYGGKIPFAAGLREVVKDSFKPMQERFQVGNSQMRNKIEALKANMDNAQEAIILHDVNLTKLSKRLESLESPIGKLPIELKDFIMLFPLILAGLIFNMALVLKRCCRKRRLLWKELEQKSEGNNKQNVW